MPKKLYLLAPVIFIAFVFFTLTDLNAFDHVCGDVNCDSACNVSDAVYIINYIFVGGTIPCDPDDDGVFDCHRFIQIGTVTDIDGNTYLTAKIGEQWWMIENLKVTHYRNGDPIPNVTDFGEWSGLTTGAYCEYDNDPSNVNTYGRLYNWYAVNDGRNIAPEGWHVPTDEEWKALEMYLGLSQAEADAEGWRGTDEGGLLKQLGITHWTSPNAAANNYSGFTALPNGIRQHNDYMNFTIDATFWSFTEITASSAWYRGLHYNHGLIHREHIENIKYYGMAIRCVKD
jgi:uncharacterized protein (TIGR02145 family)